MVAHMSDSRFYTFGEDDMGDSATSLEIRSEERSIDVVCSRLPRDEERSPSDGRTDVGMAGIAKSISCP